MAKGGTCHSLLKVELGTRSEKKRDYVGKIPKKIAKVYGKIAEVIWKNSKPKAHITSAIFPYNLRNLLGIFSRIITVYF